jgi:hypothetical protein
MPKWLSGALKIAAQGAAAAIIQKAIEKLQPKPQPPAPVPPGDDTDPPPPRRPDYV